MFIQLGKKHFLSSNGEQVLLLIDWDNFFYSLMTRFGPGEMDIERRIKQLMAWTRKEAGKILGGSGFVFAPEHLSWTHQEICVNNGLKMITCPKKRLAKPTPNPKSGRLETTTDTVDETIIWFARTWVGHPKFRTLCLVSGDNDYVPLLKEMPKYGIRRALIAPTIESLKKTKELIKCVDKNPITQRKMILVLDRDSSTA